MEKSGIQKSSSRQITAKRRSRFGCRNCKLRKTKCDETKPNCKNCFVFGVVCNFSHHVPDLQSRYSTPENRKSSTTRSAIPLMLPDSISDSPLVCYGPGVIPLDQRDQALFQRFRHRTLHSLGGESMVHIFEGALFRDCFRYRFLMHALLAVSAAHDRFLGITLTHDHLQTVREVHHSGRCLLDFKEILSKPLEEAQKDAIWATAVFISLLSSLSARIQSYEQSWPLRTDDTSTLEWLRLKASDRSLWILADPLRKGSAFSAMGRFHTQLWRTKLPTEGVDGIPRKLTVLCQLDESSTATSNPYFVFAHSLSRLFGGPVPTLAAAFTCIIRMTGGFQELLEERDSVALVLLYLWYTKARKIKWWLEFRATYVIPAIEMYLKRFHGEIGDRFDLDTIMD